MAAYVYNNTSDQTVVTNFIAGDTITKQSGPGNLFFTGTSVGCTGPVTYVAGGTLLIWYPQTDNQTMFATGATFNLGTGGIFLFKNTSGRTFTVNGNFSGAGLVQLQGDEPGAPPSTLTLPGTITGVNGWSDTYGQRGVGIWQRGTLKVKELARTTPLNAATGSTSILWCEPTSGSGVFESTVFVSTSASSFGTSVLAAHGTVPVKFGHATTGSVRKDPAAGGDATFALGGTSSLDNTMLYNVVLPGAGMLLFNKRDSGRWILEGNNSALTNASTLTGGTLKAKHNNALGDNAASLTMSANTTLALGLDTSNNPISISKPISAIGTIANEDGANTLSGAITMTGATAFDVAASSSLTVSSIISNAFTISKIGTGTLNLTNPASSFSGTPTISAGTLAASTLAASGSNSSIGAGSTIAFTGTGVLQYPAASTTGVTLNRSLTFTNTAGAGFENNGGTLALTGTATMNGTNIIVLSGTHGAAAPGFSTLASSLGEGSDTGFNKSGTGRWIVSGNNNLGGTTVVSGGTLMGAGTRGATNAKLLGSSVTVEAGGRIQLGSDSGQKGKNRYGSLIVNGTSGNRAKVRIGGSAISPTVQMSGTLTISGAVTWDLSADVFKTPGTYTLIEFTGSGDLTGGAASLANVTVTKPTGFSSRTFALNYVATAPKTVTVTIS